MEKLIKIIKSTMKIKWVFLAVFLIYGNLIQSQFFQLTSYESEYFAPSSLKIHQYQNNTFFIYQNLENNISIYQFANDSLKFKFTIESSCTALKSYGTYKNNLVLFGFEGFVVYDIFNGTILRKYEKPILGINTLQDGFIQSTSLNEKSYIDIENLKVFNEEKFLTKSEKFYYGLKLINDSLNLVKTNKVDSQSEFLTKVAVNSEYNYLKNKNTYLFKKADNTLVFLDTNSDSIFVGPLFDDVVLYFNTYNDSNFILIGKTEQKKSISIINKNNDQVNRIINDLPNSVYQVLESKNNQIVFRDPTNLYIYDTILHTTEKYFVSSDFAILHDTIFLSYYNPNKYTFVNILSGKQYVSKAGRFKGGYSSDFSSITFVHDHKYYSILKDEKNGNRINQIDVDNNQEKPISSDDLIENYGLGNAIDYNQNELYFSDFHTSMKPNIYSKESNDGIIDFESTLQIVSNYVKNKNTIYYCVKNSASHQDSTKLYFDFMSYNIESKIEKKEVENLEIKSYQKPILNLLGDLVRLYISNVHESTYLGTWNIQSKTWISINNFSGPFLNNIIYTSDNYIYAQVSRASGTKIIKYNKNDISIVNTLFESTSQFITVDFIKEENFIILDNNILKIYNKGQINNLKSFSTNVTISIKKFDHCSKILINANDNKTYLIDTQTNELQEFEEKLSFSDQILCDDQSLVYINEIETTIYPLNDIKEIKNYFIYGYNFLGYYDNELHYYDALNSKILVLDTLLNVVELKSLNYQLFNIKILNKGNFDSPKVLLLKDDEVNYSNNLWYIYLYYPEKRSIEEVIVCEDKLSVYNDYQNKGYILKDSTLYFIGASLENGLQLYQYLIPDYQIISKTNSLNFPDNILIYPNPTLNQLNFSVEADKVEIFNVSGNLLVSKESISNIDVSALIEGLYIVLIYKGSNIYTKKFVKI